MGNVCITHKCGFPLPTQEWITDNTSIRGSENKFMFCPGCEELIEIPTKDKPYVDLGIIEGMDKRALYILKDFMHATTELFELIPRYPVKDSNAKET